RRTKFQVLASQSGSEMSLKNTFSAASEAVPLQSQPRASSAETDKWIKHTAPSRLPALQISFREPKQHSGRTRYHLYYP
ncbi:MAG: hypothetical protein WBM04_14215, partial [Candidatus Korobacteraceae bacterium]